jgi:hypothetical protein
VRSLSGSAAPFLIRAGTLGDGDGLAATPTPTPSASPSALTISSVLSPVEPLVLGVPIADSLAIGSSRAFSFQSADNSEYTVFTDTSSLGFYGDVALEVCGETDCITSDGPNVYSSEQVLVTPGNKLFGGFRATSTIRVTCMGNKWSSSTPQTCSYSVAVVPGASRPGQSPSPTVAPLTVSRYTLFLDTSVSETAGPEVRVFQLFPVSFLGGFTVTLTVSGGVDAEVALGTALPAGDALLPTSWRRAWPRRQKRSAIGLNTITSC